MEIDVYCDESRPELFTSRILAGSEQFVIIGSLWIESALRNDFKSKIKQLRETHNVHGEFKWNRVSPSREFFYTSLIDLFFEEPMRFRCILLPAHQLDAVQFHKADNELMFYKFYYLMLHNWIYDFNGYQIFVDIKTNRVKQRLKHLYQFLDNTNYFAEIKSVQALPSDEVDLLQLVDLLIGAVGSKFNGGGSSLAKKNVVGTIEKHLEHKLQPTHKMEEKFNVFRWRPGGGW